VKFEPIAELGIVSAIANSPVPSYTLNQVRTTGKFQDIGGTMPRQKTREELLDRIDELEAENETLQDQIDSIQDIIAGEDEGE
jgi:hypothetical protein